MDTDVAKRLMGSLNLDYLVRTTSRLAQVPTEVPLGYDTFMAPDDAKLVHYVQNVLRPEIQGLGYYDLIDVPDNNLVVRISGTGNGRQPLLIQNYTVVQHHNLMDPSLTGRVASARQYGVDEPAIFGQGVSQCKVHQATMLTLLKALAESEVQLDGTLYWAVNNEGRSSHICSNAILDALDEQPFFGLIQIGSDQAVSIGNRGRVDVNIHVHGRVAHSSTPSEGLSAIDGANWVLNRLKSLSWSDADPVLGTRHALAYKIRYEPVAPHTIPSDAYIAVDRRLLPGDSPEEATEELRTLLTDSDPWRVEVEEGYHMLPALVDPEHEGVMALKTAIEQATGRDAQTFYGQGSFDAGGPTSRGVPTVMYGASGGQWPTGVDFVPISAAQQEAEVLASFIGHLLSAR